MATINEQLRDEAIAHTLFVSRYATGTAKKMVKILNQTDANLTAQLLEAMDGLPAESFTVKRLEGLLGSVKKLNQQAVQAAYSSLTDELLNLAGHEADYHLTLFDSLMPEPVTKKFPLAAITAEQVYSAAVSQPFQGRLLKDWASNLESDRLTRIVNTVRTGYLAGETTDKIAKKVRGTKANSYQDGALQMSRANWTSITKTAVNHLAANAREKFVANNSDILDSKQWLSTLDNKTTPTCIVRDRLKYSLDNKPIGHKVPYLQGPGKIHFCCRSTETLVTKSWRELGIDADEMDAGTRASMDGQVPADTTYIDWLSRQSPARQDQVLGPERGRLYRAGELKLSDMFTDKGEWISLSQLKAASTTEPAGQLPGFSLSGVSTIADLEKMMTGRVAKEVQFPEGVDLADAKAAAQAMYDMIGRFDLPALSWFGTREGVKDSAAGAYYPEEQLVHVAPWALQSDTWKYIHTNAAQAGYKALALSGAEGYADSDTLKRIISSLESVPYAGVESVAGTVSHELGHHLYYQHEAELSALAAKGYADGWGLPLSFYARSKAEELFAESLALYMLGSDKDRNRIYPELLKWLDDNGKK